MKARRNKISRSEFRKLCEEEVASRFGSLGFKEYDAGAFGRERSGFIQGFGLSPDSSLRQFCVPVGVLVPALWKKDDYILGAHAPSFEISHRLGEFRNNCTGIDIWYHFNTERELRSCFDQIYDDFTAQALPWLERFQTLNDVVEEYYRYRLGPLESGEVRPPNPFVSASYAWMLELIGRPHQAREWIVRAREELAQRQSDGLFSAEEQRLSQMLSAS